MICEIISVGTELLMGQILNTNAQFLAVKMKELGIGLYNQVTVGDNFDNLKNALKTAWDRADIIITTGGMGPTDDDMTKECIAEFLDMKLIVDEYSLENIKQRFAQRNRTYTSNNDKQAMFVSGAKILPNANGTAPGCIIEKDGKIIIILPGPPREMNPMFENSVIPYLSKFSDGVIFAQFIQLFGIGEAQTEFEIKDLIEKQTNPTIATYVKPGLVSIRVAAKAENEDAAKQLNKPIIDEILKRFGNKVFAVDDKLLNEVVAQSLIDNNITLGIAESCSGGLLTDAFVQISGISSVLMLGAVTYSNQAKMDVLGVNKQTLDSFGAVSKQTAMEMADGIRKISKSKIGLSTTGIAGPKSDDSNKPVGLVYIGLSSENETIVEELHLRGNRENIRNMTVLHALDMVRRYFIDKEIF